MKSFIINEDNNLELVVSDVNVAMVCYTYSEEELSGEDSNGNSLFAQFFEGTKKDFSKQIEPWLIRMIVEYNATNIAIYDNNDGTLYVEEDMEDGENISDIVDWLWDNIAVSFA